MYLKRCIDIHYLLNIGENANSRRIIVWNFNCYSLLESFGFYKTQFPFLILICSFGLDLKFIKSPSITFLWIFLLFAFMTFIFYYYYILQVIYPFITWKNQKKYFQKNDINYYFFGRRRGSQLLCYQTNCN